MRAMGLMVAMWGLLALGCEAPGKACNESCGSDDDCASGLICGRFQGTGEQVCAPAECRDCASGCTIILDTDRAEGGGCRFGECQ